MAYASHVDTIMTTYAPMFNGSEFGDNMSEAIQCEIQKPEHLWSPILLAIFSLFGIVGNLCLLIVILMNPQLRTAPNAMVLNLTIGDLLYLVISAPFHIEHDIHPCYQYGAIGCKVLNAGQVVGMCVCVLSLTAVSGERYMAITRKIRIGKGRAFCQTAISMVLIWAISIIFATPVFIMADMMPGVPICLALPHFELPSKVYVCVLFLFMYLIPLVLITVFYLKMARVLFRSTRSFKGEKQPGEKQFVMRRRLAVTILVMSVFFACFWLPYHIYQMWFELSFTLEDIYAGRSFAAINFNRTFHYFMAFANSCLNPWIVFFMSSKHRQGIIACCGGNKNPQREPTTCMATSTSKVRNSTWNENSSHAQYTEMSAM